MNERPSAHNRNGLNLNKLKRFHLSTDKIKQIKQATEAIQKQFMRDRIRGIIQSNRTKLEFNGNSLAECLLIPFSQRYEAVNSRAQLADFYKNNTCDQNLIKVRVRDNQLSVAISNQKSVETNYNQSKVKQYRAKSERSIESILAQRHYLGMGNQAKS